MSKKSFFLMLIAMVMIAWPFASSVHAADSYSFVTKWGTSGTGEGEFQFPYDAATDDAGNVYVADTNNHRIQKFSSSGAFISAWGSEGSGASQFEYPTGIAVHGNNVYVTDNQNNRVEKFTTDGIFVSTWGSFGSADGQFINPYALAIDSAGNVYITDTFNNRVQKFSATGTFLTKWGTTGSGDGEFNLPVYITIDSSDKVYVTDQNNNRVEKFSSSGAFIIKWGTAGSGDGQFITPLGIAADSSNNIFVIDQGNNHIEKFDSDGNYLNVKIGSPGSGDGQFDGPIGMTIDNSDNLYVADANNQRIQKFVPDNAAPTFGSLNPHSTYQGNTEEITINGANFSDGVTSVNFGNGITINSLTIESSTEMTVSISAARTASVGLRDISITNSAPGGGTTTASLVFNVMKTQSAGGGLNTNPAEVPTATLSPGMLPTAASLSPSATETTATKICSPYISAFMRRGAASDQVIKLQTFLSKEGSYVGGIITGYFGMLTEAAVNRFQSKYAADILAPQNLAAPTGFARDFTQKKINTIACDMGL